MIYIDLLTKDKLTKKVKEFIHALKSNAPNKVRGKQNSLLGLMLYLHFVYCYLIFSLTNDH